VICIPGKNRENGQASNNGSDILLLARTVKVITFVE